MKSKAMLFLAAGLVLFLLGGLVMTQVVQAQYQKMKPYPMAGPCNRIEWDYDSGWVSIGLTNEILLKHSLGGDPDEYFVYLVGKAYGVGLHQLLIGGADWNVGTDTCTQGGWWQECSSDHIRLKGGSGIHHYANARVRILKNQ
jgi:hypothetical protein